MQPKINYQIEMERTIQRLQQRGERPKLVLHACCAPCSSAVLERLHETFEVIVYYYNPNIAPEDEFRHRAEEQERLVAQMPLKDVRVVEGPYDPERFYALVRGLEQETEGGARCGVCFEMRLRRTAEFAREVGAKYFTTTLSISPLKDAQRLNALGIAIGNEMGVDYLCSDFKKKNGYRRSCELSEIYGLYRQDYCGCIFSQRERQRAKALKKMGTSDGMIGGEN